MFYVECRDTFKSLKKSAKLAVVSSLEKVRYI
jgi:hypothetical protein